MNREICGFTSIYNEIDETEIYLSQSQENRAAVSSAEDIVMHGFTMRQW